jgi:hypothetical protein
MGNYHRIADRADDRPGHDLEACYTNDFAPDSWLQQLNERWIPAAGSPVRCSSCRSSASATHSWCGSLTHCSHTHSRNEYDVLCVFQEQEDWQVTDNILIPAGRQWKRFMRLFFQTTWMTVWINWTGKKIAACSLFSFPRRLYLSLIVTRPVSEH